MREKKRGSTYSALDRCTTRCKRERRRQANGRPTFRQAHFRSDFFKLLSCLYTICTMFSAQSLFHCLQVKRTKCDGMFKK